jgi:hypothetical protein
MIFWTMHAGRDTEAKKLLRSSSLKFESSKFGASHSNRLNFIRWSMGSRRRAEANNRLETEDVGTALEGKSSPSASLSRVIACSHDGRGWAAPCLPRFG